MRPREFIARLGAAASPAALPQKRPAVPVIGYLSARPSESDATLAAFRRGLGEIGYAEGLNVAIRLSSMFMYLRELAVAGILLALSQVAGAAEYPSRPVKVLVGLSAGGGTDSVARILCQRLSAALGQSFFVENQTGMGGNLAAQAAIRSAPNGYTLLFAGPNNVISTSLYKKLPFDFVRDTTPIAGVMRLTNLMTVPPSLPVHTVREFIDFAKANPGKLSMASSGYGTSVHLSGELFKAMTKTEMVHVPYRGGSAVYPDLMSGKVHVLFGNLTGVIELVHAGHLRALAVTAVQRSAALPNIPTIAETVPGYEADAWYGAVAPRGTPPEIVTILNNAIKSALADPQLVARFTEVGGETSFMSPGEFGNFIVAETEKWRKVVEFAHLSLE
jgi:tripartite-type tricarboxylate transporter receptor subunit TctC